MIKKLIPSKYEMLETFTNPSWLAMLILVWILFSLSISGRLPYIGSKKPVTGIFVGLALGAMGCIGGAIFYIFCIVVVSLFSAVFIWALDLFLD